MTTQPAPPTPACSPSCPCRIPRTFRGPWVVFSTGERHELVETVPDLRGVTLSEQRLARSRFFRYEVRA